MRTTLALAVLLILAAPATAQEGVHRVDATGKVIECYCTDREGRRRELGEIICLTVGERSYEAKCVMAGNVPFWRDQNRGCLSSRAPLPGAGTTAG